MRWKPGLASEARADRMDAGIRPRRDGTSLPRQAQAQRRRRRLNNGPSVQRRRRFELARSIPLDAITRAGPDVVDDFPQEIPITRRELEVIETYLGALLDALEGTE